MEMDSRIVDAESIAQDAYHLGLRFKARYECSVTTSGETEKILEDTGKMRATVRGS